MCGRTLKTLITGRVMSEPFIAEIIMFGGNFAPRGWAFCEGQLLPISQNTALFSLIGTIYGGDGRTTMGLPDLRGRVPIHPGTGPGLPTYQLGQRGGQATHTLTTNEIPSHNHNVSVHNEDGDKSTPAGSAFAKSGSQLNFSDEDADGTMRTNTISNAGGNQAHNIMQPFLAVNYIIALQGIFPSRS